MFLQSHLRWFSIPKLTQGAGYEEVHTWRCSIKMYPIKTRTIHKKTPAMMPFLVKLIGCLLLSLNTQKKSYNTFMYGSKNFSVKANQTILKSTIKFLKNSERFTDPFF